MDDEDLFGQFGKLNWLFHKYNMKNHLAFGPMGDPYRGQGRILSLLKMQPEMSQKDLSFILGIRPQSLGELLCKLEKAGYIEREISETDRRAMNIRLTEEGKKVADHMESGHKLFSCLSDDEREQLGGYLQRIIDSIGKELGDDDMYIGMDMEEMKKFLKENMMKFKDAFQNIDDLRDQRCREYK